MLELPPPEYLPCERCGGSVPYGLGDEHVCDEERRLEYLLFQERGAIAAFDESLAGWLDTPAGRFAQHEAARLRP